MSAGAIFVFAALMLTVCNFYSEQKAGNVSAEVLSMLDMENVTADTENMADYIVNPQMSMPKKTVDGKDYVGTVSIPAIGITLPVMAQWSSENSKTAPCVYDGTPYKNNMIIAGHNYKTHFGPINNLSIGDSVVFKDMDGNIFNYKVIYTEVINGSDAKGMKTGDWDLTLFTCTYSGTSRITVRCKSTD